MFSGLPSSNFCIGWCRLAVPRGNRPTACIRITRVHPATPGTSPELGATVFCNALNFCRYRAESCGVSDDAGEITLYCCAVNNPPVWSSATRLPSGKILTDERRLLESHDCVTLRYVAFARAMTKPRSTIRSNRRSQVVRCRTDSQTSSGSDAFRSSELLTLAECVICRARLWPWPCDQAQRAECSRIRGTANLRLACPLQSGSTCT